MKKIIFLLIVLIAGFFTLKEKEKFQIKNNTSVVLSEKTEEVKSRIEVASSEVQDVESIKESFENNQELKTLKDYEMLLEKKEADLNALGLIKKANSETLTAEESKLLLLKMRENVAINQIIADKKLKNFARKYL